MVQIIATDDENSIFKSTATVTINIKDTNDNSPKFPQELYKLDIAENSPAGTELATITVSPVADSYSDSLRLHTHIPLVEQTDVISFPQADDPDTMDKDNLTYRLLPDSMYGKPVSLQI